MVAMGWIRLAYQCTWLSPIQHFESNLSRYFLYLFIYLFVHVESNFPFAECLHEKIVRDSNRLRKMGKKGLTGNLTDWDHKQVYRFWPKQDSLLADHPLTPLWPFYMFINLLKVIMHKILKNKKHSTVLDDSYIRGMIFRAQWEMKSSVL